MLKLWHCADARSFRVLWMLEEMQLPYELVLLPFPPRFHAREFLAINPLGTIPYFTDGADILTESSGILHYLAETRGPTPLAVRPGEPGYASYVNFLFQSDATFTFPQTLVLRYRVLEPPERRQPTVADDYAKWFLARMRAVESALADGRAYLVAGRFTAADIAVGYACLLAETLGLLESTGPHTQRWWSGLKQRDSFERAKLAQGSGSLYA